ncbi:MAG: peptidylprolyl isomerase [Oscillospiraceae bacterium]|jgi:hypothetical protein|nr:peptidylprolyl isomerase [Oscillospiraceae bacterium]
MRLRRIFALALCAALAAAALSGCKKGGEIGYEDPPPPAEVEGSGFDYTSAMAYYAPDEIMLRYGDFDVTWEELYFFLAADVAGADSAYGPIEEWDAEYAAGSGQSYREMILEDVLNTLKIYISVEYGAEQTGVELSDDDLASIASQREALVAQYGGEEGFAAYLAGNNATEKVFNWSASLNIMYSAIFEKIFGGEYAPNVPDEAVEAFLAENEYFKAQHILIKIVDDANAPLPEAEIAAARIKAENILADLRAYSGDDFPAYFTSVMLASSQDPAGVQTYPGGYIFPVGTMMPEFEAGTRALEAYGLSGIVETSYGYHIIYRLPLGFDEADMDGVSMRQRVAYAEMDVKFAAWEAELDARREDAAFASLRLEDVFKRV